MPGARDLDSLHRYPDRADTDRESLDRLLDEVLVGTLSTVVDGLPWAVPMLFARDGDSVLLHGSTGAGALRQVAAGAPAAFSVTAVDALVVSATTFDSSANYRSAVIRGMLTNLEGDEKWGALERLSDRLVPGRTAEVRPMNKRELAATLAMTLPIVDGSWIYKSRDGLADTPADSGAEDDVWTGVVPLKTSFGAPQPSPWSERLPVPASVRRLSER